MDLLCGLRGHKIIYDNFFTFYDLGQMLPQKNITMIVTVTKYKRSFSTEILEKKVKRIDIVQHSPLLKIQFLFLTFQKKKKFFSAKYAA